MTEGKSNPPVPWHMWVLGVVLLLWQGLATVDYIATVVRFEPYLAGYPEETLSYYFSAPPWMYVMWGAGSVGGLIGVILLLMRRSLAVPVFAVAWICSVIAAIYTVANPPPGGGNNVFLAVVLIISLLILVYLHWLKRRGVLR